MAGRRLKKVRKKKNEGKDRTVTKGYGQKKRMGAKGRFPGIVEKRGEIIDSIEWKMAWVSACVVHLFPSHTRILATFTPVLFLTPNSADGVNLLLSSFPIGRFFPCSLIGSTVLAPILSVTFGGVYKANDHPSQLTSLRSNTLDLYFSLS